jgi:3-(3-hydroxy-phenyl)propionate hydroxylase
MKAANPQVVVIGAGPVGLVTAIGLAQKNLKVLVLEKNSVEVPPQWRGSTIHPPTLAIFNELGLAEKIIEGAVKVDVLQFRDLEIDQVVNFKYKVLENLVKYPFRLQFEQYKVLKLLRDTASNHENIEIQYEVEVESVSQNETGVIIEVQQSGGPKTIQAPWLVAADGAHSSVRKSLGIKLDGFTYPFPTTVVATPFKFENHISDLAPVTYWSGPTGRLSMIKTPDIWRIAMTTPLDGVDISSDDRGTIAKPSEDFTNAISLLLKWIPGVTLDDLQLKQYEVYRSHQRIAQVFNLGRVALAGDAAHLTTTNGGMGLNSGVQDAAHLVKALLVAIRDESIEPINDYARDRKEFCEKFLQPTTSNNHLTVDNPDEANRRLRLSELFSDSKNAEVELQVVARASMITELVKLGN